MLPLRASTICKSAIGEEPAAGVRGATVETDSYLRGAERARAIGNSGFLARAGPDGHAGRCGCRRQARVAASPRGAVRVRRLLYGFVAALLPGGRARGRDRP